MDKTEQEIFWMGEFGKDYTARCQNEDLIAANTALFARILKSTVGISSVLEFGANVGMNLRAIRNLLPNVKLSAVEINPDACLGLRLWGGCGVFEGSVFDFPNPVGNHYDITLAKGLLIHILPERLPDVYDRLYSASSKYILISEYYNPTPVEASYRGHIGKLFKRDFAGEMLDRYHDLELVDYGFVYHRDANFKQDDTTWFLMQKK